MNAQEVALSTGKISSQTLVIVVHAPHRVSVEIPTLLRAVVVDIPSLTSEAVVHFLGQVAGRVLPEVEQVRVVSLQHIIGMPLEVESGEAEDIRLRLHIADEVTHYENCLMRRLAVRRPEAS